ncbi:recombination protein NinB [Acinetobacter pittii]|uniref:recombination protein NinB n=1 Tax=Acinetobacter pittii TaxID=48296 RepID=UPI001E505213|nr:recombination protein NinB [Acinetobacter pittii]MDP7845795.1 recombination protein NinB [Acinetobacter pittii]MDP7869939.1 recombination protein NinB [Acinetobacter pittii]UFN54579.1 recombination protein NinB [Acinetobacter pittii]
MEFRQVVNNHCDISSVTNFLNLNLGKAAIEGKPLVVTIKPQSTKRSLNQNALYWDWMQEIQNKTGQDKEDCHFEFKKKFLIHILRRDDEGFAEMCHAITMLKQSESEQYEAVANGVIRETSTTRLSTKQFSEYMGLIQAYVTKELGIFLKAPDDQPF